MASHSGARSDSESGHPLSKDPALPMDFNRLQLVAETLSEKAYVLNIFFKSSWESIAAMDSALRSEEFQKWENAAHKLKGAAANFGMIALEHICRQSEKAVDADYSQRSALLQQLKSELAHIKTYIAKQDPALIISIA
ncbi:MAG: Hpt domain-containing protein [Alphaproteobacteria bacterium]|nr:Hpt domain-containing protein [Alphaproteobacteria bacterium]